MYLFTMLREVVGAIVDSVSLLFLIQIITSKKNYIRENIRRSLLFILACSLLMVTYSNQPRSVFLAIIGIVLVIISLIVINRVSLCIAVTIMLISLLLNYVTEIGVALGTTAIYGISIHQLVSLPEYAWLMAVAMILAKVIQLIILFFVNRAKLNLEKFYFLNKENKAITFVLFQFCIILLSIFYITDKRVVQDSFLQHASVFAVYIILIILGVFDLIEREKSLKIERDVLVQKEYIKNMDMVVDAIRREKHDFVNHLNTLIALCMLKKPDTLERVDSYARKLINNAEMNFKYYHSGNTYIDGLLSVKSDFAQKNDINIDAEFNASLHLADMDDVELTSIISNILDNAFETLIYFPIENKKRIVSIYSYFEKDKIYISISNNGIQIPEEHMKKIFDKKFSTKKEITKVDRGFGLYITKQLLKKQKGEIFVTSTAQETEFLIQINMKEESENIAVRGVVNQGM